MQIQLQKHSLLHFVQTNEEVKIVDAIEKSIQIANLKDSTPLLQVVAKWRLYIGLPKDDVSEELSIVRDFIHENFPHLTIKEIELAYNLSVLRKLDDCEFYGYFSPLYVGKVLDSYLYYRKRNMADLIRRKEKYNYLLLEEKNKPKPEEEAELTKSIFVDFYKQHKEGLEITDVFNICWNFLRKQKMINPQKTELDEALAFAKTKIQKQENDFYKYTTLGIDKESESKRYARNYCVQKYFDRVDINELLNKIKPELFS